MTGPIIRDRRAFASGALFLAFAVFFFVTALNYPAGTAARMGPGYFPGCSRLRSPQSGWSSCWEP
jgi:hypothetical protein